MTKLWVHFLIYSIYWHNLISYVLPFVDLLNGLAHLLKYFLACSLAQDEIARIRKWKRGRNMLNRSGNTTDNLCFRYRFRDVFSRFRCCVYNGTGPLLRKHNGNMELHVSATFPFTDSCNFVLCWLPCVITFFVLP